MTLSFSQKWPKSMGELAGQPNYFVEKILKGLPDENNYYPCECQSCGWKGMSSLCDGGGQIADTGCYSDPICPKCESIHLWDFDNVVLINNGYYHQSDLVQKFHTIRRDPSNRWKAGMDIHFVINNRTKNRFQFAPVMKCVSVQSIEILHYRIGAEVRIDGKVISGNDIHQLALNDGFPNAVSFCEYFNEDFHGKIIHWTDLKY